MPCGVLVKEKKKVYCFVCVIVRHTLQDFWKVHLDDVVRIGLFQSTFCLLYYELQYKVSI